MAIKAYVGRMGSGKTYEVVSVVILEALKRGRRVVSNIAGLQYDAFCDLLESQGVDRNKIGQLVHVDHDKVLDPLFWRSDKDAQEGIASFIEPGDLVALDEIWRFWSGFSAKSDDGSKRPDRVMNFFRMHRHMTHPDTGVACDVALITQDVMDISRQVRSVVEETYRMSKLTAIGSTSRYRVDVFTGARVVRKPLRMFLRSYDPRYFSLYSSHSQKQDGAADAREENIDGRGNILKGALFKFVLPVGVVVLIAAVYFLIGFFHPEPKQAKSAHAVQAPATVLGGASSAPSAAPAPAPLDSTWRAAGYWSSGDHISVFLYEGRRSRVIHDPPNVQVKPLALSVALPDGGFATSYSGAGSERPTPVEVPK